MMGKFCMASLDINDAKVKTSDSNGVNLGGNQTFHVITQGEKSQFCTFFGNKSSFNLAEMTFITRI